MQIKNKKFLKAVRVIRYKNLSNISNVAINNPGNLRQDWRAVLKAKNIVLLKAKTLN